MTAGTELLLSVDGFGLPFRTAVFGRGTDGAHPEAFCLVRDLAGEILWPTPDGPEQVDARPGDWLVLEGTDSRAGSGIVTRLAWSVGARPAGSRAAIERLDGDGIVWVEIDTLGDYFFRLEAWSNLGELATCGVPVLATPS